MAAKKRSVGLLVVSRFPDEGVAAVLWRRPSTDSFPRACQVTCHGRIEEGESVFDALRREAFEELGERAAKQILPSNLEGLTLLTQKSDEREDAVTYGIFVQDPSFWDSLEPEVPGGQFLRRPLVDIDTIRELTPADKKQEVIAMHADEKEAVHRASEEFLPPV